MQNLNFAQVSGKNIVLYLVVKILLNSRHTGKCQVYHSLLLNNAKWQCSKVCSINFQVYLQRLNNHQEIFITKGKQLIKTQYTVYSK